MSDYRTTVSISRDDMVDMLYDDDQEQTAYVLAGLASNLERGSKAYRDFTNCLLDLDSDEKDALKMFCAAIIEDLEVTTHEPPANHR